MQKSRRYWFRTLAGAAGLKCLGAGSPLFDGHTFDGWIQAGHGLWTIENEAITGRSDPARPGPGYLMTKREYDDFTLSLEFNVTRGGNSGIYVREPRREWGTKGDERPAHGAHPGYEVQIDYNDPKNLTGALYNVCKPSRLAGGEDRWNRMRIECAGPRIRVWVGRAGHGLQPVAAGKGCDRVPGSRAEGARSRDPVPPH